MKTAALDQQYMLYTHHTANNEKKCSGSAKCIHPDHTTNNKNYSGTAKHNMFTQTMPQTIKKKCSGSAKSIHMDHTTNNKNYSGTAKHNMFTQTMPQTMKKTNVLGQQNILYIHRPPHKQLF